MAVEAPQLVGGATVLGSNATRLSNVDTPMCQLTIRSVRDANAGITYVGNSDISGVNNCIAFIRSDESYSWGPYERGGGIRPSQVFLYGVAGTVVVWSGFPG